MSNSLKIKPIGDKIVVKPIVEENKTKTGIFIPDTVSKESPQRGEVIALGEGRKNKKGEKIPFTVKIGDQVLFKKYSPTEFSLDEEEYLILSEDDVLGIIQ